MSNNQKRKVIFIEQKSWQGNPSIGRNDKCPCGSGMKYKHCHLPSREQFFCEKIKEFNK
jgi:uncharacterized protein YecA (UPF0149 family)